MLKLIRFEKIDKYYEEGDVEGKNDELSHGRSAEGKIYLAGVSAGKCLSLNQLSGPNT